MHSSCASPAAGGRLQCCQVTELENFVKMLKQQSSVARNPALKIWPPCPLSRCARAPVLPFILPNISRSIDSWTKEKVGGKSNTKTKGHRAVRACARSLAQWRRLRRQLVDPREIEDNNTKHEVKLFPAGKWKV